MRLKFGSKSYYLFLYTLQLFLLFSNKKVAPIETIRKASKAFTSLAKKVLFDGNIYQRKGGETAVAKSYFTILGI